MIKKRGRVPKPKALKEIEGVRRDRINGAEPEPQAGRPQPPEYLSERACAEWDRMCDLLERTRVLTVADGSSLGLYCDAYDRMLQARDAIDRLGMVIETPGGGVKQNPAATILMQSVRTMHAILIEFGCTPAARSRVSVQPKAEDELENFLAE
jgi:P27 family predicted phage terminase small subunit